jgi:hypothetical protein
MLRREARRLRPTVRHSIQGSGSAHVVRRAIAPIGLIGGVPATVARDLIGFLVLRAATRPSAAYSSDGKPFDHRHPGGPVLEGGRELVAERER